MLLEQATDRVKACFNGEAASCSYACPFHLDIRAFMEKAAAGRWLPAYKLLRNAVVFPEIVAALCPETCMGHCQRSAVGDEPLSMLGLERAALRLAKSRKPENFAIPPKPEKIAIAGSNLFGLSCALSLSQKGYQVTVFEPGPVFSIPSPELFADEVKMQFSSVKCEFRFDSAPPVPSSGFAHVLDAASTSLPPLLQIAEGQDEALRIEALLQTGTARLVKPPDERSKCDRYLDHSGAERKPRVVPADASAGYSAEEAKAEASRCFRCDCDYCERGCEMLKAFRKKPHQIAVDVFGDTQTSALAGHRLVRETYSCNVCGHCKEVCPTGVDIGELLQFSREARFEDGSAPVALHDYWLREFDFHNALLDAALRDDRRDDGSMAGGVVQYAFFPGCQLGASNAERVSRTLDHLKRRHEVALVPGCCGAPAYWAGDAARRRSAESGIRGAWERLGKPTFALACAYCRNMFERFLPEIATVSVYELLAQDAPGTTTDSAAFHVFDPCAARGYAEMQTAVRSLLGPQSASPAAGSFRCCGHGGHIRLANRDLYGEIVEHRTRESELPYVVYCANCWEVFTLAGKECRHILDLLFGIDAQLPTLDEKKENARRLAGVRRQLPVGGDPWDGLRLTVGADLMTELRRKFIELADIRETIYKAERDGAWFCRESDGARQAALERKVVTFWVRYKVHRPESGDPEYEIVGAFTHAMKYDRGAASPEKA
ncbi:MAG: 4Fe-4S dicluster domain-containing protein [Acidobacteriota bacterium]|nr:4Fe-4S dicluster domain-containing protein [Acidobacteriota bacterium]